MLAYFIIVGLACWRISNMIIAEDGPMYVFTRIRKRLNIDEPDDGEGFTDGEWYKDLFKCVWCLSVWVAIAIVMVYLLSPWLALLLSFPFAISAFAILFHGVISKISV